MDVSTSTGAATLVPAPRPNRIGVGFARARHADWLAGAAGLWLLLMLVCAVLAAAVAPHSPTEQDLLARLSPPVWGHAGSWSHALGTDELGRDVLSRLVAGARVDLLIGILAATIELVVGVALGLAAGYFGGWIDTVVMRWSDIQMGFPAALIIVFVLLLFGANPTTLTLALGLNGWMIFNRLVRSEVRRLKGEQFVQAALVTGASTVTIMRRHILPHLRGRIVAVFMLEVPRVILAAATLSFIGLGVQPPTVSWGLMIGDSRDLLSVAYWTGVFPGLMIVGTVASLYVVASWLEPKLDPLRRGRSGSGGGR